MDALNEAVDSFDNEQATILLETSDHMARARASMAHPKCPGSLPIHIGAHRGTMGKNPLAPRLLESLIAASKDDINALNAAGRTPLHLACGTGDEKMVQDLLQARADPTIQAWDKKKRLYVSCQDLAHNSGRHFARQVSDLL